MKLLNNETALRNPWPLYNAFVSLRFFAPKGQHLNNPVPIVIGSPSYEQNRVLRPGLNFVQSTNVISDGTRKIFNNHNQVRNRWILLNDFLRYCFFALKGQYFNSPGQTTKECRPGYKQNRVLRPGLNFVQSTNVISDGTRMIFRKSYHSLLITILFLGFWVKGYSQAPDSLFHYLEIATKNNPTVLQRYAEYEAALQKVPQVGGLPDPELSMGVFLSPMEQLGGNQVADLRLMQMFPWFGVLKNAKDEMSLMAKAKYESFRDAKMQTLYGVQLTWFELYKLRQDILISEKNIGILRSIERMSLVKFKTASTVGGNAAPSGSNMSGSNVPNAPSNASGMGGGMSGSAAAGSSTASSNQPVPMGSASGATGLADLYRIQIEIGELENNLALLKNQQSTVTTRFNNYLDRPATSAVSLPDTLKPDTLGISLVAVADSIQSNNPMLGMLHYEQQSLDARKKMVTRMSYPMVGLGLNYSLINKSDMSTSAMNGKDMIMPMVIVTLPIYRKKYRTMQSETNLMISAGEEGLKAASNSLESEYYEAMQFYQDAQRRMTLYEDQSQLAQKSLDILVKSFSVSGVSLSEILRVRQQALDYEFKQVEALSDYNSSIAWLRRLMACSQIQ